MKLIYATARNGEKNERMFNEMRMKLNFWAIEQTVNDWPATK